MNWIKIDQIDNYNIEGENILIWQSNLTNKEDSRFQRAVYNKGNTKVSSFIVIYPLTNRQRYMESDNWIGYDLEGDKTQITHFAIVEAPNN
jgi:hypothetical protein